MGILMLALLAATLASSHAQPAAEPAPAPALGCAWAQLRDASRLPGVDEWSVDLQLPVSMLASGSQAQLVERAARDLQAQGTGLVSDLSSVKSDVRSWDTAFLLPAAAAGESKAAGNGGSLTPFNTPATLRLRTGLDAYPADGGWEDGIGGRRRRLLKKDRQGEPSTDLRLKAAIDASTFSLDDFQARVGWPDEDSDGNKASVAIIGKQKCVGLGEYVTVQYKHIDPSGLDISTPAGVETYFPGLTELDPAANLTDSTPLKVHAFQYVNTAKWPCPTWDGAQVDCALEIFYPTAEAAAAGEGGTTGQLILQFSTPKDPDELAYVAYVLAKAAEALAARGWETGPEGDI